MCGTEYITNIIVILQEKQEPQTLATSLNGGNGHHAVKLVEEVFGPGEESVYRYYPEVLSTAEETP